MASKSGQSKCKIDLYLGHFRMMIRFDFQRNLALAFVGTLISKAEQHGNSAEKLWELKMYILIELPSEYVRPRESTKLLPFYFAVRSSEKNEGLLRFGFCANRST